MNHSGIRYCFQLWKAKESIVFCPSFVSFDPRRPVRGNRGKCGSTVNPNDMNLNTPPAIAGNIPQDVTERAGENAVFIVYGLKETPRTADRIKDLCANFGHDPQHTQPIPRHAVQLYDGIRGRRMEPSFPGTAGNRGNSKRSKRSKAPGIRRFPRPETCFSTSGAGRWAFVSNSLPSSTKA